MTHQIYVLTPFGKICDGGISFSIFLQTTFEKPERLKRNSSFGVPLGMMLMPSISTSSTSISNFFNRRKVTNNLFNCQTFPLFSSSYAPSKLQSIDFKSVSQANFLCQYVKELFIIYSHRLSHGGITLAFDF